MTKKKLAEMIKSGVPLEKFESILTDPDQQKGVDMLAAGIGIMLAFDPMLERFTAEQIVLAVIKLGTEGLIMAGISEEKVSELVKSFTSRAATLRKEYLEKIETDESFAAQPTVASQFFDSEPAHNVTGFDEFFHDPKVVDMLNDRSKVSPQIVIIDKNSDKVH